MKKHSSLKVKGRIKPIESIDPIERMPWTIVLFIAVITVLFYLPILNNGFVNWDDATAIIENYHIRSLNLSSFHWMLTTFHTGNWIPLTWLSLALDYAVGHLDPKIYHMNNLILHTLNTLLVFFISFKILKLAAIADHRIKNSLNLFSAKISSEWTGKIPLTLWAASLAALLFGLHPIHVESVAWATERKDLLCSLFFFASLLIYLDNVSSNKQKIWKWVACWLLFALSLLSKPMAITLPFVFLLLDIWPLKRFNSNFSKILAEKVPFFILSLIFSVITIMAQDQAGAISDVEKLPIDFRIMNAFHSLVFYAWKMILPINLVPFYPIAHQGQMAFSAANLLAFLIVSFISIICYYYRKQKPYLAVAVLYYFLTLAPVLGILQVGSQAAADRYSYIPSVSLFLIFSAFIVVILSHHRRVLASLSTAMILILGLATVKQLAIWKDHISLWESVVKAYPNTSIVVHTNMANAYKQFGQFNEALREYDRALALRQPHAYIYDGKGMVLLDKGLADEAIREFQQAIALDSQYASPHRNLWFAYEKKGLHELALAEIQEALKINPEFVEAYNNLGISYGRKAQFEDALEAFKIAHSFDPYNSTYLINLATTYQRNGQLDQAIDWYKKGIKLNSNESIYFLNLAHTYLLKGMLAEAIATLQTATNIQPPNSDIFQKLGMAYEKSGQKELALQNYEKALNFKEKK